MNRVTYNSYEVACMFITDHIILVRSSPCLLLFHLPAGRQVYNSSFFISLAFSPFNTAANAGFLISWYGFSLHQVVKRIAYVGARDWLAVTWA